MKAKVLILLLGLGFSFSIMMAGVPVKTMTSPQDNGTRYGKDSVKCIMNLSLYREFYRQWKQSHYRNAAVKDAVTPWYWTFRNCPRATENIYVDGAKIIGYKIRNAADAKKKQLIDTLMMVYDQRIKYFPNNYRSHLPQEGYILGRKGVNLYQVDPNSYKKAYEILKRSVDLEGAKSKGAVLVYYFRAITKMARQGDVDTAAVVDAYDHISDIVDMNIKKFEAQNNSRKLSEYKNIKGSIELTFEPFAKCTDLVRIYQKKYDAAPSDVDLLKKIIRILENKRCSEDPLYFNANVSLYKADPSPESAYLIGKMMLKKEKYQDAITYLKAATHSDDTAKVVKIYMYLADAYRSLNNFPQARAMARASLKYDRHNGAAYMLIGDLYAESAKKCGNNDLTSKVAYWAAVDKYIQAKKADPEMADALNKRIAIYKAHFPTTETMFFYNIKAGDKYKVPCWINELTIARASK